MGRRVVAIGVTSLIAAAAAAACALDIPDVVTDAGPDGTAEASVDAGPTEAALPDAAVPSCEAGACGAPAGFAPVLFASNRSTACPSGTQSIDLPADPGGAGASACSCDCNVTTQPDCVPQVLLHGIDTDGGGCGTVSVFKPVVDGGCNAAQAIPVSPYWSVAPFPPTDAGSCTGTPTGNATSVTTTPSRLCVDQSCGTCAAPPGFQVCFASFGDVPCPAGTKHLSGAAPTLTCGPCTGCSVSGDCGGSVSLYTDTACQTPLGVTVPVDGGCTATQSGGATLGSLEYHPAVVNLGCKPGKSTPTGTGMTSPVTICCP